MKASKLLATLALSAVLFTGCGINQNAIIKINDKAITQSEYDTLMDRSIGQSPFGKMGDLKGNKDGFLYLMMEQNVINQLIITELLDQEADSRGIKVSNKDIEEAMQKTIDQIGGKDQLMNVLKANGISVSDFKKDLANQVKMQKLANSVGKISVSDKDCENYYKKNPKKFQNPEKVRASHILISANAYQMQEELKQKAGKKKLTTEEIKSKVDQQMADKKAKAEDLAKKLKADKTKFESYAKKYSEDTVSAERGGDLGFFAKEQMVKEFADVAFSIKPDTVSDVVKTQYGYHIIYVQDRREAGLTPYEKAKNGIKDYLVTEKQIKVLDDLTEAAKKNAKIEYMNERYNPENIQKKLSKQVDDATGGQASKVKNANKKSK